jgi:hypothetical protein
VAANNNQKLWEVASIDSITKMSPKYHQSCTRLLCFPSPARITLDSVRQ